MTPFTAQETIETLNSILDIEQSASGIVYLKELVKNIAQTFNIKIVLVGHALKPGSDSIQTDVVWVANDFQDNFTYSLKGTPCENVLSGNRVCVYPKDTPEQFPEDQLLVEMGVESYVGAPILKRDGELSGILALLNDKPAEHTVFFTGMVEFLAERIGLELERFYIEEELKRQVAERTSELEKTNKELKKALSEIKTLQGILPICSFCKKIRDDKGYWNQLESYIHTHSELMFSHSVCPECMKKQYPYTAAKTDKEKE